MEIKQYTEDSLTLLFGEEISEETNKQIVNTRKYIDDLAIDGIVETIISYTRLVIYFDLLKVSAEDIKKEINTIDFDKITNEDFEYKVVEIPVVYGQEFGPDLASFEDSGLSAEDVVAMHSNKEYLVYMLGFMPGFVYLGGLNEKIFKDRLDKPRTNIAAGSVGIAGQQTGMYPFDSPGGWNLIGRTPVRLFDVRRGEDAIIYDAGDRIVFRPIDRDRYDEIAEQVEEGTYEVKVTMKGGENK